MQPDLRIAAVPTPLAIAVNVDADWQHVGVLLAAKRAGDAAGTVYGALLKRNPDGTTNFDGEPRIATPEGLLADWPRPLVITGEGAEFCDLPETNGVTVVAPERWLPTAEGVWTVGRRLARAGGFTPWNELQVTYARRPEAVRLWEKRHSSA
jgi:tRNA A37 threonylcarbamoyladenosine modification protein TsaB